MSFINILSNFRLEVNNEYPIQIWSVHFIMDGSSHLFGLKYVGKSENGVSHLYKGDCKFSIPMLDFQIIILENEKTNHLNIKFDGRREIGTKISFYSEIFEFSCDCKKMVIRDIDDKKEDNSNYLFQSINSTKEKIKLLEEGILKLKEEYQKLKSDYIDLQLKHHLTISTLENIIHKNK